MTTTRPLFALCALAVAGSLAGCDSDTPAAEFFEAEAAEPETPEAAPTRVEAALTVRSDFSAVGHVDLATVTRAPSIQDAWSHTQVEFDAKLGPCAAVMNKTGAITFGAGPDAFEVYIEGSFEAAEANACTDFIDAEVTRRHTRLEGRPRPEATLLGDGMFVIFGGETTPSRERRADLLAADPSPGGEPMWLTGKVKGGGQPVDSITAWARPGEGFEAHVEALFNDEGKASEIYGKATLGLAAMSLSGEVGELASAVDLDSSGKTLSAELSLSAAQMKTLMARGKARHQARMKIRAEARDDEPQDSGFQIQIEASK